MQDFFLNSGLESSYLRVLSEKCDEVNGINLSQGVCDDGTPAKLLDEAIKSLIDGNNSYVSHFGIEDLRTVIATKASISNASTILADEVVISSGATGAFICACMTLFEKGDEVIVMEPFYPYHVITMRALGICPVTCKYVDKGFTVINFDALDKQITSRTKAILICTPSNPTGKVLSKQELECFARICSKHNLYLISDEIYEYITYQEPQSHISVLSQRDVWPKIVAISGFSKTFAVTGWRVGYTITDSELAKKISLVNDFYYVCAPSPFQYALAKSYSNIDDQYYLEMKMSYKSKRDYMLTTLRSANMNAHTPQGSYYLLADSSVLDGENSLQKALFLLNETGVAAVPGQSFFLNPSDGKNILRFCFAKSDTALQKARQRLSMLLS